MKTKAMILRSIVRRKQLASLECTLGSGGCLASGTQVHITGELDSYYYY